MANPVTLIAPIKLKAGKTEGDLLAASANFQRDFVSKESGVLRRELVKGDGGMYYDIVHFRSAKDAEEVEEKEKNSPVCHLYFGIMDFEGMDPSSIQRYETLATYQSQAEMADAL